MVNGPASGGEFPLGKEYWENISKESEEGFVPKKTIKVPVGETQQGESTQNLKKVYTKKEIAKLIKKAKIEQKVMMDHMEVIKPANTVKASGANGVLAEIVKNIPTEDLEKLTTKSALIKYIKEHPELKQSVELNEVKTEEKSPTDDSTEAKKPYIKSEVNVLPDVTKEVDENGVTHFYKKDPSEGEAGWKEISQQEYGYIRAQWEGKDVAPVNEPTKTDEAVAEEKFPDLTREVDENGVTHFYKKDPSEGEAGWKEISPEKYASYRAKLEDKEDS